MTHKSMYSCISYCLSKNCPDLSQRCNLGPHLIKIYRTIILLVVLYGCETWSLTLREERRLRVFEENRVLWRIFGPKRDEVTGEWRKLHNEGSNDLYCSPNIVRVIKSKRIKWVPKLHRCDKSGQFFLKQYEMQEYILL